MTARSDLGDAILAVVGDAALRADLDRLAAAAGVEVVHVAEPSTRKAWLAATAVVVDAHGAARCAGAGMIRRDRVLFVGAGEPSAADWAGAVAVGAQRVYALSGDESTLVGELADAAARRGDATASGVAVAVLGGRGGAGASVFATALAFAAGESLLVDGDPWGGGLDLLVGAENVAGLRWPDVALGGGRVAYPDLRAALPRRHGVAVLAAARHGAPIDPGALATVVDSAQRAGATVVCDVGRSAGRATDVAVAEADLAVVVTPAELRAAAAAAALARRIGAINPNVGVVVRGPAPGGLRAADVAGIVGVPLLASMRAQPGLSGDLERDGFRPRRRTPVMAAAREVLAMVTARAAETVAVAA